MNRVEWGPGAPPFFLAFVPLRMVTIKPIFLASHWYREGHVTQLWPMSYSMGCFCGAFPIVLKGTHRAGSACDDKYFGVHFASVQSEGVLA